MTTSPGLPYNLFIAVIIKVLTYFYKCCRPIIHVEIVIARYQGSSHIVKTLTIYYFMLIEYMREISKLLIIHIPTKLKLKKKLKKG